jgi:hypothetical protein
MRAAERGWEGRTLEPFIEELNLRVGFNPLRVSRGGDRYQAGEKERQLVGEGYIEGESSLVEERVREEWLTERATRGKHERKWQRRRSCRHKWEREGPVWGNERSRGRERRGQGRERVRGLGERKRTSISWERESGKSIQCKMMGQRKNRILCGRVEWSDFFTLEFLN